MPFLVLFRVLTNGTVFLARSTTATTVIVVLTLLAGASALTAGTAKAVAGSPLEKVVQLLEELKTNLVADEKTGQQVYDKYACWCETATGRKAAASTWLT